MKFLQYDNEIFDTPYFDSFLLILAKLALTFCTAVCNLSVFLYIFLNFETRRALNNTIYDRSL